MAAIEVFGLVLSNCARVFLRKSSGFGLRETGLRRTSAAHKTHENGRGPSRNVHFRQRVPAPRHRAQSLDTHGKDHENAEVQREPRKGRLLAIITYLRQNPEDSDIPKNRITSTFVNFTRPRGPCASHRRGRRQPCNCLLLFHRRVSRLIDPAGCGRSAWRDREVGMQSEQGWPRIILAVYPRPPGEEGAPDRDSSMRTGLNLHVDPKPFLPRLFSARLVPAL